MLIYGGGGGRGDWMADFRFLLISKTVAKRTTTTTTTIPKTIPTLPNGMLLNRGAGVGMGVAAGRTLKLLLLPTPPTSYNPIEINWLPLHC